MRQGGALGIMVSAITFKGEIMVYQKGMKARCRKTGREYDPMVELNRILEENKELFQRMKFR